MSTHSNSVNTATAAAPKPVAFWSQLRDRLRRSVAGAPTAHTLPAGTRVYAVGDVHGRLDLLDKLQQIMARDAAGAAVRRIDVYLGDYIDRGPDSKGVIDRLLAGGVAGAEAIHLRGNHDQSLLDFLADPTHYRIWKNYGAPETLFSYGVTPPRLDDDDAFIEARNRLRDVLPPPHLAFLNGLPLSTEIGDYFFVHAGVRPGLPLGKQDPADLLTIREDFLGSTADFGKVVVHGHTPANAPALRANRIGVDTGAYATGRLTCAVLEGDSCRFLNT